ncbi:MAG TPA: adenylate/guanylate cyclase domain-containing protein [Bacteroidales bacterium]|nr:adenylate/guanylate cyclase domain-containing protein [Bacteroidales bacterium]
MLEDQFNAEMFKSERLRALILVGLLSLEAVVLIINYSLYQEAYLQIFESYIAIYAILIFTVLLIVYEVLIHYLLLKMRKRFFLNPRVFGYFNAFSEITLLSFLLIFIVEYTRQTTILQTPATLTYFIFIVLSTLRFSFKLSVFTGTLAALEFVGISIYYSTYRAGGSIPEAEALSLTGMQYFGQGIIMLITGIAAGFVADLIKRKEQKSLQVLNEKNEIIDLFGQQISQQIANSILEKKDELAGIKKNVSVMFLDIRNFTPFVENHQPEEVVTYLNDLFCFMIRIVEEHHGVINQFVGDGFMATFGAPVSRGNTASDAVLAATEIIAELKSELATGNLPDTRVGIGIHYGEAIIGNIGSSLRKQYSITGNVVIIASRIEQLNKKHHSQLLISEEVFDRLNEAEKKNFDSAELTMVKGSNKLFSIYRYLENNYEEHKSK